MKTRSQAAVATGAALPLIDGKISIPFVGGTEFIHHHDIIMLIAAGNQSCVYIEGRQFPLVCSKTLGAMEKLLPPDDFMRIQKSFIVNRNHITKHMKGNGGYFEMSNEEKAYISEELRETIADRIAAMNRH